MKSINHSIACNNDFTITNIFTQKVFTTQLCRRKIICSDTSSYQSVHLFWPWAIYIASTQTSLNMRNRYLMIESSKCSCGTGSCISVYKQYVWYTRLENITHTKQYARGDIIQILSLLHNIQVEVGLYIEKRKNLIKHFSMLTCDTHYCFEFFFMCLKRLHQRCHLYSLRAGSKHKHYLFHFILFITFPILFLSTASVLSIFPITDFLSI